MSQETQLVTPTKEPEVGVSQRCEKTINSPGLPAAWQAEPMVDSTGQLIWTLGPKEGSRAMPGEPSGVPDLGKKEHYVLVTVKSHFHKTVPVFDALIPWLPLPCQGQNLGLSVQGRTKQFCFLGKWEVWDGEHSLWRGDYHSWRHWLPSLTLSPESRNQTAQHLPFQPEALLDRVILIFFRKIHAQKND